MQTNNKEAHSFGLFGGKARRRRTLVGLALLLQSLVALLEKDSALLIFLFSNIASHRQQSQH
jgi:hypothetical protein